MLCKLLEEKKEVLKDKVLVDGHMIMTDTAKKRLTEIDLEIGRLKGKMDNRELVKEIEDRIAGMYDEVIENIKLELEYKVGSKLGTIEKYLDGIVEVLEGLVESKEE